VQLIPIVWLVSNDMRTAPTGPKTFTLKPAACLRN
jgi:hypothetical protein